MNKYELSVVIDGKASPAKKKSVTERIAKMVELLKGKVGKLTDFGEKAYGIVLLFPLELVGESAKNLLTKVRQDEDIKKHLLIRV